jgi:uncharacterized damage-inducible protein DinB
MDVTTAILLTALDEAFDRKSWHGTNLRGSIRGLGVRDVTWRPGAGRHNIWEIAVHAAYWKYAVRRRLTGEKRGAFTLKGSNWFERPGGITDRDAQWKADVALLVAEHQQLRRAVEQLSPADLERCTPGSGVPNRMLVTGTAAHDVYHAGQIQLLKRLHPRRAS